MAKPGRKGRPAPLMVKAAFLSVGCALILCVSGMMALVCLTMPAELDARLTAELEARMLGFSAAGATCAQDGTVISMDPGNCHDRAGFRVVTGNRIRVFSLRYAEPLFVFGMENGMVFTSEKMSRALLASEKSAFIRYANNAR